MTQDKTSIESIFRAYDIRGVYGKTLDEEIMERIGHAFSSSIEGNTVVVARDGRLSGESLADAFINGILSAGKNVIYAGLLPLGAGMFHAWRNGMTFAYVTASHLPKEWNGLKFFKASGIGFMENDLMQVKEAFLQGFRISGRKGRLDAAETVRIKEAYIKHLLSRIMPRRKMKVVIDAGNGAAGVLARELFERSGFDVHAISENIDGGFPSRNPDPVTDELSKLRKNLDGRDIGIAYDGDGDRMVILDERGSRLTPEQISYILLSELLKNQAGPVVANVETTRTIDMIAERFGRKVYRVRVGHNYLMHATFEKHACFGMEPSGHYTIPSIFPFDDSLAISYYFSCVLSRMERPLSMLVSGIPLLPFERISIDVPDEKKFNIIRSLSRDLVARYPKTSTLDGIRIDLDSGWVLIRPSNTQPKIRLTVEAKTEQELESLKAEFMGMLKKYIKT